MTVVLPGLRAAFATGLRRKRNLCFKRVNHPGVGSGAAGGSSRSILVERDSLADAGAADSGGCGTAARDLRQKASWESQATSVEKNRVKVAFCRCQLLLYSGTKQSGLKRKASQVH